jgi:hypothetical protein
MPHNRMSIDQIRVHGLNPYRKGPINICPKGSRYKDRGTLSSNVADGIIIFILHLENVNNKEM